MSLELAPGATYELSIDWGTTGATLGARVLDNAGNTVVARFTGFTEYPAGAAIYYKGGLTAPTTAGQYTVFIDDDGGTGAPGHTATEDMVVTHSAAASTLPDGRDLCALADVTQLVPGYSSDTDTDAVLAALITSESRTAHQIAGREFVTIAGATTRQFDIGQSACKSRRVRVGDMTTVTTVTIKDIDGTTLETVAAADRVSLPRVREEWEPITRLWFPPTVAAASNLWAGNVLEVVGVWGFPSIPSDLVTAVAKMVLVRYLADSASSGTALSDALNEQGFDAGMAFASARDVIRSYQAPPFA